MSPRISWEGVFPAVATQFNDDLSLNIDATAKVMDGLIRDGVSGLIVCGSVGENRTGAVRRMRMPLRPPGFGAMFCTWPVRRSYRIGVRPP